MVPIIGTARDGRKTGRGHEAVGEVGRNAYLDRRVEPTHLPSEPAMTVQIGDRIPSATLTRATDEGPKPVSTDEIFAGKTVALFAVPGAFTPTCSARHLPGFKDHQEDLKAKGVDTIACVSVNDAFVMGAWADSQGIGKDDILMLGDGNGDFTRQLGLSLDAKGFGMGERSQRYSMIVRDGVVEQLNIEQPGEFKISSAEHLLTQL
jgi:peroxiredoxin